VSFPTLSIHTDSCGEVKHAVAVVAAEQETAEQHDKAEPQPAAMPDYAAGLLAPTFDVSVSSAIIIIFMWLLMFALLAWQHEGLPQSW